MSNPELSSDPCKIGTKVQEFCRNAARMSPIVSASFAASQTDNYFWSKEQLLFLPFISICLFPLIIC
jgi:hypothetical protein